MAAKLPTIRSNLFDLEQLKHRLNGLAPYLFFVLLLWLCWRLASLFWLVIAPIQPPVVQSVMLGSQQPIMPDIVRFALFQEQGQAPQAQQNQTNLVNQFKLTGVLLANPNYLSSAVINNGTQSNRYRVGETIDGSQAKLAEVHWNSVILSDEQGQKTTLSFAPESGISDLDMSTQINNVANPSPNGSYFSNNVPPLQPNNPNNDDPRAALGQAINRLEQDRGQYLNRMGLTAQGGGLEITDSTPPALRARLGLKAGDKILSINGQNLSAGVSEAQILEQIKRSGQAKIEIQRGEQTMTIQQNF